MEDREYFDLKFKNIDAKLDKVDTKITRLFERQDKHHDALIIHEEKFKNIKESKDRAWKLILSVSSSLIVLIIISIFSYIKLKGG